MEAINTALQGLQIGEPQGFRNLAAFPLLLRNAPRAGYITLSEAMRKQTARITEISEGGSVPELLLDNTGAEKVLILDGEELIGAKQNRIANLTILADANSKTVIPVSCVEQGRWSYRSADFQTSSRLMFHRSRAAKAVSLNENMKATGTHGANQGQVWANIQAKQSRMGVNSPTSSMADMYDDHHERIEDYADKFRPVENQVGVLFAIDGEIEGMDLFDATDTFARMLPKLTRSFAIDALESAGSEVQAVETKKASRFLDRVAAAHIDSYRGVGLGEDVRLSAPLVAGGGLIYEDKLIHMAAFRAAGPGRTGAGDRDQQRSIFDTRMQSRRYSRMRRRNGGGENGDH
jgi:hypothetical protein